MSAKKQQELIDLHWNEPQLEIIDDAIDSIEKGHDNYCCLAGGIPPPAPTTKSDDSKLFVLSVRLA